MNVNPKILFIIDIILYSSIGYISRFNNALIFTLCFGTVIYRVVMGEYNQND